MVVMLCFVDKGIGERKQKRRDKANIQWALIFIKDILSETAWLVKSAAAMTINSNNDWKHWKSSNKKSFRARLETYQKRLKDLLKAIWVELDAQ